MKQIVRLVLVTSVMGMTSADSSEWVERVGDVLQIALPVTGLTATYSLDDPDGRKMLLWSYGSTFAITQIAKEAVGKQRPDGSDHRSFPSGHTSSAFSGAAFLAKRYGWDVGLPAYLAASFVGYSRVQADKHDWWDVTAGAGLAMGVNALLVSKPDDSVAWAFLPTKKGMVFDVSWQF